MTPMPVEGCMFSLGSRPNPIVLTSKNGTPQWGQGFGSGIDPSV